MYRLTLKQGCDDMIFEFKNEERLKKFMFDALWHSVPDERGDKLEVRVEKSAEGDNPESARDE